MTEPVPASVAVAADPSDGDDHANRLRNRLIGLLVVVAAAIALLASLPGLDEVQAELSGVSVGWTFGAVGLEYLSCVGYVLTILLVFYRGPTIMTARLAWSELAANVVLPAGGLGGLGLGAWVLSSKGVPARRIAERSSVVFFITSVPVIFALIGVGLALWLRLLAGPDSIWLTLVPALLGIAVIFAVLYGARMLKRLAQRSDRGRLRRVLTRSPRGSTARSRRSSSGTGD